MNKKEQYVAAIDIGTTKIVAIVGKKNENGKIEILGLSKALSKGVKRGVVLNIEETVNAIHTTVEDVQKRSGILFSEVFVGIAGQHIKSMKNRGYIMREAYDDEIKEAGVVLVDIGGGTTDVAVYYDNIIRHTAVIPFGGNVVTKDIKEGCAILQRHAEQLKIQYGSALGDIAPEDKVVSIPGISGREPKEISFKSLAYIIQSRMEEIIDAVNFEIQNSGYADKLAAGVVITGGGAMLKHLPQLMKFKTAMDVRIGLPNEHLAGTAKNEINQPMYATSVGLIMRGFEYLETYKKTFNAANSDDYIQPKAVIS